MKRFTTKWFACAMAFLMGSTPLLAQQNHSEHEHGRASKKCGTMDLVNQALKNDPTLKTKWKAELENLAKKSKAGQMTDLLGRAQRNAAGEIVIPVVFHLIAPAGVLATLPDRDVYNQLDILNKDFNGQKLKEYVAAGNLPQSLIDRTGNARLKFVLARRNPQGQLSSGILRVASNLQIPDARGSSQAMLKSTNSGGSDAWDPTAYLNVWCGDLDNTGLLGVATFPGVDFGGGPQGVIIDIRLVGSNTCRPYNFSYNEGATLSHEVGHYLFLRHAFGDDNGACGPSDFRADFGEVFPDSANIRADDTPDEDDARYGNVSGIFRDNCTNIGDGIFYGNYMNYFSDRSLFMFSKSQTARANACLSLFRSSLLTSNGATPPSATVDAYLVTSNPTSGCDTRVPVLPGAAVTALLRNYGTTTLTSATLGFIIGNNPPVTINWTGSLAAGAETNVSIGAIPSTVSGFNFLQVYVANPNNATDNFPSNDTLVHQVNVRSAQVSAPLFVDFAGSTFGFAINNPNFDTTWRINVIGSSATSPRSASINCAQSRIYNSIDELVSPAIDFGAADSGVLSFKYAYKAWGAETQRFDGLEVFVSGDDGATYTRIFRKYGTDLATTAGFQTTPVFVPTFNEWSTVQVDLSPYIRPGKKLLLRFQALTSNGQVIYIDDIGVTSVLRPPVDAALTALVGAPVACTNAYNASLILRNAGATPLTGITISYRLDNGTPATINYAPTLPSVASVPVAIPTISNVSVGQHSLTAWISNVASGVDNNKINDTVRINFFIVSNVVAPVVEGFEGTAFPPAGWATVNADRANTWVRAGKATSSTAGDGNAALIANFQNPNKFTTDDMRSPVVSYSGVDSVYVSFDVASANQFYLGGSQFSLDNLSVFISTDCGQTLRQVYSKSGPELQTVAPNVSSTNAFVPANAAAYRRDSINITNFLPNNNGSFQVIFRNTSQGDNNIYVDNINIYTKTLPARLKDQGYLLTPTVTTGTFYIRQYQNFGNLRAVNVFNNAGARVATYNFFNQSASGFMPIDLSAQASGVYFVQLMFNDKTITERVIKVNR